MIVALYQNAIMYLDVLFHCIPSYKSQLLAVC